MLPLPPTFNSTTANRPRPDEGSLPSIIRTSAHPHFIQAHCCSSCPLKSLTELTMTRHQDFSSLWNRCRLQNLFSHGLHIARFNCAIIGQPIHCQFLPDAAAAQSRTTCVRVEAPYLIAFRVFSTRRTALSFCSTGAANITSPFASVLT